MLYIAINSCKGVSSLYSANSTETINMFNKPGSQNSKKDKYATARILHVYFSVHILTIHLHKVFFKTKWLIDTF